MSLVDNKNFTPRDYEIELISQSKERNIIICLASKSSKEFCALKLIQELSHELRSKEKTTLYITSSSTNVFNLIHYLTDLSVINLNSSCNEETNIESLLDYQVVILEIKLCLHALENSLLNLNRINLIIIDDCHLRTRKSEITEIFLKYYNHASSKPKILGLAGPIHSAACNIGILDAELEYLESLLNAKTETASDIVTVLR